MVQAVTAEYISHLHFLTVNRSNLLRQLEWDVIQRDWMPHCRDHLLMTGRWDKKREGSEEYFPQSEKTVPLPSQATQGQLFRVTLIHWPSSPSLSAKVQGRRSTFWSLSFTCPMVCRRCGFSSLFSIFSVRLEKISPLKGLPVKQEEGKGWLLSASVPPFPVLFRITKVFYCPCSWHSLDVSP